MAKKTLVQIERILKADIGWAITKGTGWDPGRGAAWTGIGFAPHQGYGGRNDDNTTKLIPCGVCAIGAFCVKRQPEGNDDVEAAAMALGKSREWINALYFGVCDFSADMTPKQVRLVIRSGVAVGKPRSAIVMAYNLVKYAEKVRARTPGARPATNA